MRNPAEVLLNAVVQHDDLDVRLLEALPRVLSTYTDLTWEWVPDRALHVLSRWESEIEEARRRNALPQFDAGA